ncbi:MAG: hypothetical protein NTX05_05730 [Fusobacteria bacterium]|nr:hypothetical protein [Fusobacteriota bacterium]
MEKDVLTSKYLRAKEKFIQLFLQHELFSTLLNQFVESEYYITVGERELELLGLGVELKFLEKKIEIVNSLITVETDIDEDQIDHVITEHMLEDEQVVEEYEKQLEECEEFLEDREKVAKSIKEAVKLYKEIIKFVHPVINKITEKEKKIFKVSQNAFYELRLDTLENIALFLEEKISVKELTDEELALNLSNINVENAVMESEIREIKGKFPFTEARNINDPLWIAEKFNEYDLKIEAMSIKKEFLEETIEEIFSELENPDVEPAN